jgi:hypothetical protein
MSHSIPYSLQYSLLINRSITLQFKCQLLPRTDGFLIRSFRSSSLFYLLVHSRCRGCLFSLDHTQTHTTVGRTPLDEGSARRRDLYLTTQTLYKTNIHAPPVGFEPTIPASARPQTYALDRAATGTGVLNFKCSHDRTVHRHWRCGGYIKYVLHVIMCQRIKWIENAFFMQKCLLIWMRYHTVYMSITLSRTQLAHCFVISFFIR